MTSATMTTTPDDEAAAYLATLTPAERAAVAADAELLEAERALDAATAEVNAARAVAAETSSAATRSRLARAQRAMAAAQEAEILASERYHRSAAAAGLEAEDQAEPEVERMKRRIRASVTVAASIVGMYGSLASAASRTSSAQLAATHLAALGELDRAVRALRFQQDAAGWPKANKGGNGHV